MSNEERHVEAAQTIVPKCWRYRDPLLMVSQVLSIVAFLLSWVHWSLLACSFASLMNHWLFWIGRLSKTRIIWCCVIYTLVLIVPLALLVGWYSQTYWKGIDGFDYCYLALIDGWYIETYWKGIESFDAPSWRDNPYIQSLWEKRKVFDTSGSIGYYKFECYPFLLSTRYEPLWYPMAMADDPDLTLVRDDCPEQVYATMAYTCAALWLISACCTLAFVVAGRYAKWEENSEEETEPQPEDNLAMEMGNKHEDTRQDDVAEGTGTDSIIVMPAQGVDSEEMDEPQLEDALAIDMGNTHVEETEAIMSAQEVDFESKMLDLFDKIDSAKNRQRKLKKQLAAAGVGIRVKKDNEIRKRMNEIGGSDFTHLSKEEQNRLCEDYVKLEMEKFNSALLIVDVTHLDKEEQNRLCEEYFKLETEIYISVSLIMEYQNRLRDPLKKIICGWMFR